MIKHRIKNFEYQLLMATIFLSTFGLIAIYSASSFYAEKIYGDAKYLLNRQLIFCIIGCLMAIAISFFNIKIFYTISFGLYIVSIIFVILSLFIGESSHGSSRWIQFLGISFQPSEMMKLSTILFLSFTINRTLNKEIKYKYLIYLAIGLVPAMIISINNLSTGIIVLFITIFALFIISEKKLPFIIILCVLILGYQFSYPVAKFFNNVGILKGYQINRIFAWKDPVNYQDITYQTIQGLYAIGSGGIFGRGLGASLQKLIMPEAHNDMIFSIICEELGFIGSLFLIFIYIFLIYRIVIIAYKQNNIFKMLIVFLIAIHISIQVILNISVVTNLIPNTGISLPFISYGGSSILVFFIEIGIIMSISSEKV